ncbi:LCP family protein [Streptomyces iconiensis]|uniref:LCP family protein n=1 Tax=Streptomyces iconiensis TaxID=1384038 RepID=A0ABT6ZMW8_9ACTN|nr:LCP family protein [Streptomyces iconiensis]MDJ1130395.1 LCP family protein [Streptomyces iconiensis]
MNDGYGHDPYGQQPEIIGYDEYGRPVYRQEAAQGGQEYPGRQHYAGQGYPAQGYAPQDPYAAPGSYDPAAPGSYDPVTPGAYDPYAQPQQPPQAPGQQQPGYDPYAGHPGQAQPGQQDPYGPYDPYGQAPGQQTAGQQQAAQQQSAAPQQSTQRQEWFPQQTPPPQQESYGQQEQGGQPAYQERGQEQAQPTVPRQAARGPGQVSGEEEYHTEQFAFVEEPTDDSEDVIDWLKFSESRTERREEAKRRGRHRIVALVVALVLVVAGGVGYLWYEGMLPGLGGAKDKGPAAAGKQRDVILVHLREAGGGSSTALLVDNASAGQGSTVLLPNSLAVSTEDGTTTTLGKSVEDQGASPTRDALDTLLGSDIKGTWRLDTPYLENLVELVGGIALDTDTSVPGAKKSDKPQVERGEAQDLDGRAAVAYATYRAQGEPQGKQLARFGQVMQAALKKLSGEPAAATKTVESLGQIPDPSLSESQLGASLAKLAERAKGGDYRTQVLPVRANGTLSRQAGEAVVEKVLGGTVKNSDPEAALRVSLKNGTGKRGMDNAASAALVNGGYTVAKGGASATRPTSLVTYAKPEQKAKAEEVAKTLGLRGTSVRKAKGSANADVTVLLGGDYKAG